MRIFLDANILFSAAKSAGAVRELLARAQSSGHALCADAYVAAEARRNLAAKAEEVLPVLDAMLARMDVAAFQATSLPADIGALLHAKDWPVLAAAVRLRCDALVTGDRNHFAVLYGRCVQGVTVCSPLMLAQALGFARR